jgi:hypothetical protein
MMATVGSDYIYLHSAHLNLSDDGQKENQNINSSQYLVVADHNCGYTTVV